MLLKASAERLRECAAMARRATSGKADLQAMLSAATRMREMADALREQAVVQARRAGWSWEAIGRSLSATGRAIGKLESMGRITQLKEGKRVLVRLAPAITSKPPSPDITSAAL